MLQVANPQFTGVQYARDHLRELIDAALERGEHTVIARNGRNVAVLVPYAWYEARQGDPDDRELHGRDLSPLQKDRP